jgi:hypothetical protein
VTTLSDTKVVSTAISTLTAHLETTSSDMAVSAMNTSLQLSGVMLASIDMFGFDFIKQAGNKIIDSAANSLLSLNYHQSIMLDSKLLT